VGDVSCDSRRIAPGSLFVGLPGGAVDGGRFWRQALAAGAAAATRQQPAPRPEPAAATNRRGKSPRPAPK
jgi:UDP-N-acetylmuramoyl-L-alanyl-D-glutamate--2,6-diaminopimelate ligase